MKVVGISPLDKDATVSLVEDGRILFAAGEERFSRVKQHAGFPYRALRAALAAAGAAPGDVDLVVYPFLDWESETRLMRGAFQQEAEYHRERPTPSPRRALRAARARKTPERSAVHGLREPDQRMEKGPLRELAYRLLGVSPFSQTAALLLSRAWMERASREHRRWQNELERGLWYSGFRARLLRAEHHLAHAANAYLASGLERALVVTLDGYGSGLSGSVSLGEGGVLRRLHDLRFPYSLGTFYEMVTSSLGFHPDRHAGKIVGLAAYGDPEALAQVLLERFDLSAGDLCIHQNLNIFFSRYLAGRFPMVDVAAAWQRVLEIAACSVVRHWLKETGASAVVLSGGVVANVKMNQRIHEIEGVEQVFIYPNMGDGGCGTGLALFESWPGGVGEPLGPVYFGPEFGRGEMRAALEEKGLRCCEPPHMPSELARRLAQGQVVGRFAGRMEYGPRALGNRSILYHAREPDVNQWLNRRLGRTEFMPFAPVTLYEARERCYHGLRGAEHAAEYMTITFDCTDWMKEHCPAAVHVDGTARPQLIRRETNPEYYDIIAEFEKLTGVPCLINTSFNMHEEPIVLTPQDAVRAFLLGRIDALALGPYLAEHPDGENARKTRSQ
ncbi:MAG: carbamoyltransferase [Planctomycetes bacterium]|nr:carbamoyltransferase [Planctomycetota bacterium]